MGQMPAMLLFRFFLIFLTFLFTAPLAIAQASPIPPPTHLGRVVFPISCKAEVRSGFEHGVALLHSFQYAGAEKAFTKVFQGDPQCAMAYWGLAMSVYHPLWEGANDKALRKGRDYLEKARKIGGTDKREREYIDALDIIFSATRVSAA